MDKPELCPSGHSFNFITVISSKVEKNDTPKVPVKSYQFSLLRVTERHLKNAFEKPMSEVIS